MEWLEAISLCCCTRVLGGIDANHSGKLFALHPQMHLNSSPGSLFPRTCKPRIVVLGAAAGVIATVSMSAVMFAFQRSGMLGRMPPRIIVERGLQTAGVRGLLSRATRQTASAMAHLGFGASQGAIYACLIDRGPQLREPPIARGASTVTAVPYAMMVWATSYAGWIPALGIMPPPSRDRPGRPTSMLISHVVFGVALATALRALARAGVART